MSAGGLRLGLLLAVCGAIFAAPTEDVGKGFVGCLFSHAVCLDGVEWCFDDHAFGRCAPRGIDPESLHHFTLTRETLHILQREMERLLVLGYRWTHLYTQCVLQIMLQSIQLGEDYDANVCGPLSDQDLNAALKALQGEEEQSLPPNQVARVQFTPSAQNPHADFADEIYAPLLEMVSEDIEGFPRNVIKAEDANYRNSDSPLRKLLLEKYDRLSKRQQTRGNEDESQMAAGVFPIDRFLSNREEPDKNSHHFSKQYNTPENFRLGIEAKDLAQALASEAVKSFSRNYNTPDTFRLGVETKDINPNYVPRDEDDQFLDDIGENVFSSPTERELLYDAYRRDDDPEDEDVDKSYVNHERARNLGIPLGGYRTAEDRLSHDLELLADDAQSDSQPDGRVFTEGGVLRLADDPDDEGVTDPDELVRDYTTGVGWGFKRRERLDVKKPGPNFNLNNYAFKNKTPKNSLEGTTAHVQTPQSVLEHELDHGKAKDPAHNERNKVRELRPIKNQEPEATLNVNIPPENLSVRKKGGAGSPQGSPNLRKPPAASSEEADDSVAFIKFKDGVNKWTDGVSFLRSAAKFLDLDPNAFSHTRVEDNEVQFKVDRSKADISASEVAKRIDGIKDKLKSSLGVEVTATGSTDSKSRQPTAVSLSSSEETQLWLLSFLLCGVIAAAAIAGAAFFFVRRHSKSKDKLMGLKQPDSEASKDYQDLCRARMVGKSASDKPESAVGRMGSTSKDGEPKSPSSRSSTSSWSEEPALTNMDISTGHMVLTYMEDHLKNKDRLEQEWIALCAYEAEPCATTVATAEFNLKKNRYPDALPYDHSRVLLNQLLNVSGADYINASTITDHDPRNPAYIATQGPLENTAADLWQMLWEQGSVVMVMLTRLSENGTQLSHRYWPEEGSQVYHIYEVHLVSEHIWCDDYLVRSFYLKNLKTGETRTVTQFHFLSWPENGVPLSTKALLEFRRKVNKSYRGRSCPIVVHCSDGVGRTGTYCLIDMVLNRMSKGAKEIDIAATLEHIRDQRPNMVKTKQQFEFVLMAVAEEVHAILKALPVTHSPPPVPKDKE